MERLLIVASVVHWPNAFADVEVKGVEEEFDGLDPVEPWFDDSGKASSMESSSVSTTPDSAVSLFQAFSPRVALIVRPNKDWFW